MQTLISRPDFLPYRNLTVNIDDSKRLEPFIIEAQRIDLCNLLGNRLYFDMLANLDTYNAGVAFAQDAATTYRPTVAEQWFQKLYNGCSYAHTWPDGSATVKIYAGLKPLMVYLSYARFVRSDNVRSTQSGFVKKTLDFSTQISDKEIQAVATRAEADANAFFTAAQEYMADNATYFRKYLNSQNCANQGPQRTGTRLTAVKGRSPSQPSPLGRAFKNY